MSTACCNQGKGAGNQRGGSGIVWIFPGWFPAFWFNRTVTVSVPDNKTKTCTPAEMINTAAGSFGAIGEFFASPDERVDIAENFAMTSEKWQQIYNAVFRKVVDFGIVNEILKGLGFPSSAFDISIEIGNAREQKKKNTKLYKIE